MVDEREPDDELLALYALDALPDDERDAVDRAIAASPRLADRVEYHRSIAADLARSTAVEPPPDLKQRVLAAAFAEEAPREVSDEPAPSVVVPLVAPARRRWNLVVGGLAAAAVIVMALLLINRNDADRTASAVLAGANGRLSAVVSDSGRIMLTGRDIPTLDRAHTYQLWLINADQHVRSAGIFVPAADGQVSSEFSVAIDDARTLAITVEPAGGSPTPAGAIEFSGALE